MSVGPFLGTAYRVGVAELPEHGETREGKWRPCRRDFGENAPGIAEVGQQPQEARHSETHVDQNVGGLLSVTRQMLPWS